MDSGKKWKLLDSYNCNIGNREKRITYTTSYAIDSNRAYIEKFTADKSSMKAGQEVTLKSEYEALADSGNKYQFLAYNGSY